MKGRRAAQSRVSAYLTLGRSVKRKPGGIGGRIRRDRAVRGILVAV